MTQSSPPVEDEQACALAVAVSALLRQFKLEPGMLAGSAYADLHINDIALLMALAESRDWTVRGLAQALSAPDSTISSALDRLEGRDLVLRERRSSDRRVMGVALTSDGDALAARLRVTQVENSRSMLERLSPEDRAHLVRLVTTVAQGRD